MMSPNDAYEANPYAPPATDAARPRRPGEPFDGRPMAWTTAGAIELAWTRVAKQKWMFAGATLLALALPQLVASAPRVLFDLDEHGIPRGSVDAYLIGVGVAQLASFAFSAYFTAGAAKMWLDAARGREARFSDLFAGFARTPSMFAATFLLLVAIGVGFMCLVLPGFVMMAGLSFAQLFVVDANMGPVRALSASWKVTRGQRLALFGFSLACGFVLAIGFAMCGVGALLAYPLVAIANAIVYLHVTGRWRPGNGEATVVAGPLR